MSFTNRSRLRLAVEDAPGSMDWNRIIGGAGVRGLPSSYLENFRVKRSLSPISRHFGSSPARSVGGRVQTPFS